MEAQTALGLTNARQQTKLVRQLKTIRQEAGMTVEEVAHATKLEPSFIVKFEKGGMNYTASTLRAVAKALGAELRFEAKRPNARFVRSASSLESEKREVNPWRKLGAHDSAGSTFNKTIKL